MKLTEIDLGLGGGTLLQVANREHTQMMSYMIKTDTGKVIMIDGGNYKRPEDAENLYDIVMQAGGKVDAWFITHAHSDHIGALVYIFEKYGNAIDIATIYFDFPDRKWLVKVGGESKKPGDTWCTDEFLKYVKEFNINCKKPTKDEIIDLGVKFEILNEALRDCDKYDDTNDTGICIKAHFKNREVLFLGDIGQAAQDNLIEDAGNRLRCDIVQMAHHGQNGVDIDLYKKVKPKVCLWPTPDWLWYNDSGDGIGSGFWKTLLTRRWMDELGVCEHYVAKDGDYLFK